MKKAVKLSTQTRNILLYVFSIIGGLICLDTYDVTNFVYSGDDNVFWWKTRIVVFKIGVMFLLLSLKLFEGMGWFNLILNCFIWVLISDIIGRFTGDTDRSFIDFVLASLTIIFCWYEYRERKRYIPD